MTTLFHLGQTFYLCLVNEGIRLNMYISQFKHRLYAVLRLIDKLYQRFSFSERRPQCGGNGRHLVTYKNSFVVLGDDLWTTEWTRRTTDLMAQFVTHKDSGYDGFCLICSCLQCWREHNEDSSTNIIVFDSFFFLLLRYSSLSSSRVGTCLRKHCIVPFMIPVFPPCL